MNATLLKAAIAFVPVSALPVYSLAVFVRRRTVPSTLQFIGATFLVVVVFTHVAEALLLCPAMRKLVKARVAQNEARKRR